MNLSGTTERPASTGSSGFPAPALTRISARVSASIPRIPAAATLILGVAAALIYLWIHGPLTDLRIYRMGGRHVLDGGDQLYNLVDGRSGYPFTYTAFAAAVFAPFAAVIAPVAEVALTILSVLALARVCQLVGRTTSLRRIPLFALAALFEPVVSTIALGQVNLVLMALVVEAFLGIGRRYAWAAGLLIGIAAGIKLTPAIFVVALWMIGRRRAAVASALGTGATVGLGFLILPSSSAQYWTGVAFDASRVGPVQFVSNQSLNGVVWRLLGPGGSRALWVLLVAVVAGVWLYALRRYARSGDVVTAMGVTAVAALLASPISWSHHWVWVVVILAILWRPLAGIPIRELISRRHYRLRLGLVLGWSVACLSWMLWLTPHNQGREYHANFLVLVVDQIYAILGVLTLGLLAFAPTLDRQAGTGATGLETSVATAR